MTIDEKIRKYCTYEDRCSQQVREKLLTYKLPSAEVESILATLVEERFVDDARYVESFIRGKVNAKRWGRIKLKAALLQKRIAPSLIDEKLQDIDNEKYMENLRYLIEKWKSLNREEERPKLYRYLLSKGYESNLIMKYI